MKNTHIALEVLEPARWYLKFTEKRKHYFQFHSSLWGDSTYLALNSDSKVILSWLLSQCLATNKPSISVCLDSISGMLSMSLDIVKDAIRELKDNDIIELQTRVRKSNKPQLIEENRIEENRREEKTISEKKSGTCILIEQIYNLWNKNAPDHDLPTVKILNADRKKKLLKAMNDFREINDWKKIFSVASTKGFTNKEGSDFVPTFDYIFRNNNWVKFYDEYDLIFKKEDSPEKIIKETEEMLFNELGM